MEETETLALENLCRVCLNYAENMTSLAETRNESQNSEQTPTPSTISALLEKVMKIKIVADHQQCPNSICATCLDILNVCHDFQVLFTNSQDCLRQYFNQNVIIDGENGHNANGVDLIFGSNKFSLDDVVILEEQVDESSDCIERLVGNLNGAVSVEIVNKSAGAKTENGTGLDGNAVEIIPGAGTKDMPMKNGDDCGDETPLPYQITIVTKNDINWNRSRCDLCPAAFSNKDKLTKHVSVQHCDRLRKDLCQDCACAFASDQIKVPPYRPPLPAFDSATRCTNCRAFLKTDHYSCEICGKTYTHGGSLKAHQEAVHDRRSSSRRNDKLCAVCGKSFARLSSLECHMRTHLDNRRRHHHAKAFCSADDKQKHELVHWDFRPFGCGDCDASFGTLHERRLHQMKMHPLKCQYCDAKFVRDSLGDVRVHLKEVHGIENGTAKA